MLVLKRAVIGQLTEDKLFLSPSEWQMMEKVTRVLKPIKAISEILCASKYPTMGYHQMGYHLRHQNDKGS